MYAMQECLMKNSSPSSRGLVRNEAASDFSNHDPLEALRSAYKSIAGDTLRRLLACCFFVAQYKADGYNSQTRHLDRSGMQSNIRNKPKPNSNVNQTF